MTAREVPAAFTREGLLGKSKAYIIRAFRAKSADDLDEYQLWASLALELLGKAALAAIHPSLVVDPNHIDSMFAASGVHLGTDFKTITAKTLYERLGRLSKYFDTNVKKFCDDISLRRNAELHSGEAPFQQMRLEAWEGKYWHAAQVILNVLDSSLEEWLGVDYARAPQERVRQVQEALVHAAVERVAQARTHFLARSKKERESALAEASSKSEYSYLELFRSVMERKWRANCPACTGLGVMGGFSYGEELVENDPEADYDQVEKMYSADEFRCPVCDLRLDGRAEIEAAGLDPDLTEIEEREREYEPDYGNC